MLAEVACYGSPMALNASDVMEREVLSVPADMTLAALEDFLISHRISGVPVVDDADRLVGIVSRSDIVRALSLERSLAGIAAEGVEQAEFAPAEAPDPLARHTDARVREGRLVREIMVVEPVTVGLETPIAEVARVLVERHLHRVLVTEGRAVRGVISALDLVQLIADGRLRES